ncbi:MFS transporter [Edaphosphingomonas haloaromaticamans]|uniref:Major Facilitator Superfamily protein n=1 Tax=Edaphosphingomonas haloaromaticamans TaxID=653954 RepID=A0A1S1HEF5_9SPHN|nr:MFS transporter [Sphingomonas haloaromaticamans]MDX3885219.1 MFS transporter [Sphingomonas sp.]OHT19593.1 Major Facilitator Superfamily protein [Sphingomonas haloaromaticamans]
MASPPLRRFLWLYPLANGGAYIAFLPLLTLIVPLRAAEIGGAGKVALLSETLAAGVLMATVANILAGMASDRTRARFGTRLPWLWIGLAASWIGYGLVLAARDMIALILAVAFFQAGFNTLFGPMTALFADKVPDRLKGRVSAFASLAWPAGLLGTALIGLPAFTGNNGRVLALIGLTALLILPLLLAWPRALADVPTPPAGADDKQARPRLSATFYSLWAAKLLVQLSGNVLHSYFLFYLQELLRHPSPHAPPTAEIGFAGIMTLSTIATALLSIAFGHSSDRADRRKPFLLAAIALMATGLGILILGSSWTAALIGYTLTTAGLGAFMTVDIALVAQILPSDRHRGRDLGVMNVANTLPAMIGPMIALTILDRMGGGYDGLFAFLLCALAGSAIILIANRTLR